MIRKRASSNVLPSLLGELELHLMNCLWQAPEQDAKSLCERLPALRASNLSTVQSALERLTRKQLVNRTKKGHAYFYNARVSRPQLLGQMMGEVIHLLHDGRLDTILSSFVHVAAELDERSLAELEALIAAKKQAREETT